MATATIYQVEMHRLERAELERILPHGKSAIFIDRITHLIRNTKGESVGAIAEVLVASALCRDHFPGLPVLPGHILMEMINLTAAAALCLDNRDLVPVISESYQFKIHQFIKPGSELTIETHLERGDHRRGIVKGEVSRRTLKENDRERELVAEMYFGFRTIPRNVFERLLRR